MMTDRDALSGDPNPNALSEADRMLAAEYALGVLEGAERAGAERRIERDPAFARAVDDWHVQLSPMLDYVEDATPSPRVWRGIESAIGRVSASRARSAATVREAADPIARQAIPAWRALMLMVVGGAFASFAMFALFDSGFLRTGDDALRAGSPATDPVTADPAATQPALVATLTPEGAAPPALARLDPSGGLSVRITLAGEDGRVPELWLIPGDGVPRSLGVLAGGDTTIALPPGIAPAAGEALAVSLEPPGGSPTGAPTGPVVASGQLIEL